MRFNGCLCLLCLFLCFLCILLGFIQLLLHGFFCLLIGGVLRFPADSFQFGFIRNGSLLCLHPQLVHFCLHGGNLFLRFLLRCFRCLLLAEQCLQFILSLLIGGIHSVILFRLEQIQLRLQFLFFCAFRFQLLQQTLHFLCCHGGNRFFFPVNLVRLADKFFPFLCRQRKQEQSLCRTVPHVRNQLRISVFLGNPHEILCGTFRKFHLVLQPCTPCAMRQCQLRLMQTLPNLDNGIACL